MQCKAHSMRSTIMRTPKVIAQKHGHQMIPYNQMWVINIKLLYLTYPNDGPKYRLFSEYWQVHRCQLQEYFGKLTVRERKSPKTKVRGSVWNCSQNEFDCLNHLMDECFAKSMSMWFLTHCLDLHIQGFYFVLSFLNYLISLCCTRIAVICKAGVRYTSLNLGVCNHGLLHFTSSLIV